MAESPGSPVAAGLKLAAVIALVVVAVCVAVWSATTALRGPKEIVLPLPPDMPMAGPPTGPAPQGPPADQTPAPPAGPAARGRPGREGP